MSDLINRLFTLPDMDVIFAPEAHVRRTLQREVAFVRAEAQRGGVPGDAAEANRRRDGRHGASRGTVA